MKARRTSGFTLIEMLAVVVLTTLVLTVAINFFIDLSRASTSATDQMRAQRRASALLDRIAHDLEGTYLVKKPKETDPLEHAWVFVAEASGPSAGADHLKFMTRSAAQRTSDEHEGDVTVVAYGARPAADGGLEVMRWTAPRMPEALDRTIPTDEEAGAQVLASGVASFSMRFLDDAGEWRNSWDSTQLAESSELPVGAEIEVSMLPEPGATTAPATAAGAASDPAAVGPFVRRVLLPLRPIDLEALLKPDEAAATAAGEDEEKKDEESATSEEGEQTEQAKADEEKDEACMTVAQCLSMNPSVLQQFPQLNSIITAIGGQCFRDVAASIPAGVSLVGCQ